MPYVVLFAVLLAGIGLIVPPKATSAEALLDSSLLAGDSGLGDYYTGLAEYYAVPRAQVLELRGKGVADTELPIALFLARQGHTTLATVQRWYAAGTSWHEIGYRYGVTAEDYYVPLRFVGPPYGKAYGRYKQMPREQWRNMELGDDDIEHLVNLRFLAERYGQTPDAVAALRGRGLSAVQVNSELRRSKGAVTSR